MLRTISTNISIVTNFGCRFNCWYCIWKTHPLKDVCEKTDWKKLDAFLKKYRSKRKVSISGGGDCLYEFDFLKPWWKKIFFLCSKHKLLIDIHSRTEFRHDLFWKKVNRCVFSSDRLSPHEIDYLNYLSDKTKIRIVHVVTKHTTKKLILKFINIAKRFNCQLTFKELVGNKDGGKYKYFKSKFPKNFFLDSGDYNIYYMPNNTITNNFMKVK